MVRVPAGGGAVQGGDGGSWRGRQRRRALAWEAAAREGQQRESRVGLGFPLHGLQTPSQKAMTPRVHTVKRSKTGIWPRLYILSPTLRQLACLGNADTYYV